ncbi:MAG TPA: argininosuccinate lyase [Paracoccaceae bacterium]|nr:argininosuccinate lyase [Paracoccaceae bacterium]
MIRAAILVAVVAGLASCGAPGDPIRPEPKQAAGVSLTGTVKAGVVVRG